MKHTLRTRALQVTLVGLAGLAFFAGGHTLHMLWQLDFPFTWVRAYCTVAASLTLALGSAAALRNKTWGLLVVVVAAISFAGAWAFGIAPLSYLAVAGGGLLALGLAAGPLWRRDRVAFVVIITLVMALGVGAAALAGPGLDLAYDHMLVT